MSTCKICGQSVDLKSGLQSDAANCVEVHHGPCLTVFMAAMTDSDGRTPEMKFALEELA